MSAWCDCGQPNCIVERIDTAIAAHDLTTVIGCDRAMRAAARVAAEYDDPELRHEAAIFISRRLGAAVPREVAAACHRLYEAVEEIFA